MTRAIGAVVYVVGTANMAATAATIAAWLGIAVIVLFVSVAYVLTAQK